MDRRTTLPVTDSIRRSATAALLTLVLWPACARAAGSNDSFPSWSPDGSKIAFSSDRDGDVEIYTVAAGGSDPARLTHTPGRDAHPSWSPDGSKIVFQSPRDGSGPRDVDLYLTAAGGSNVERLTRLDGFAGVPVFSPDGATIVFQYKPKAAEWDAERWQIWIMAAGGTDLRQLTRDDADNQVPVFSPGGRRILYYSNRSGSNQLWHMDAEGGEAQQVTFLDGEATAGAYSPDGRRIAFVWAWRDSHEVRTREVYLMAAGGSKPERVTRGLAVWGVPFFSPDGARLLVNSVEDGRFVIDVVRLDGTRVRRVGE